MSKKRRKAQIEDLVARIDELTRKLKRADDKVLGWQLCAERLKVELDSIDRTESIDLSVTATAVDLSKSLHETVTAYEKHLEAMKKAVLRGGVEE